MDCDGAVLPTGGLRVLEICDDQSYAIAYGAKLLADLGADVVVVEGPDGHGLRRGHSGAAHDVTVAGAVFEFLTDSKRIVGVDALDRVPSPLLEWADVIITTETNRVDLTAGGRRAIVTVSPWGSDGPSVGRAVTSLTLQAASGWVNERKEPGQWPVQVGGHMHEWASGSYIATAALTAHRSAERTDRSVTVDVSLMECLHAMLCYDRLRYDARSEMGVNPDAVIAAPFGIRRCADGLIGINILTHQQWRQACLMTGLDDYIAKQAELSRGEGDVAGFTAQLERYLADKSVAEIFELGQTLRVPIVPVAGGDGIRQLEQWVQRPFFEQFASSERHVVRPGPPWRMTGTRQLLVDASLVADRPAAADESAAAAASLPDMSQAGTSHLPFDGLRVLDLSHFWSAPYMTMYLGAFGADVIKIESIQRPDAFRLNLTSPKLGATWYERSLFWQATNLDKRDITLDLTSAAGRDLFMRLLADADVVVENFSPRVLEQFGLTFDELRMVNPSVILMRLPGYGLEGPWRDFVGWGDAFEQLAGWASVTGYSDGLPQTPGGYMDPMVAMHGAAALIAELRHREVTGRGELIEVPQVEVAASMAAEQIIAGSLGHEARRYGNRSPSHAPQGVYRCAGNEREFVALSIRDDDEWRRLRTLMGSPAQLDSREMDTMSGRHAHHDAIDRVINEWTAAMTPQVAATVLTNAGIPAAWVLRAVRFNDEPHLVSRRFYELSTHRYSGPRLYPRFPMRYSFETGPHHRLPPPTLGQHNGEVLGGQLGLSGTEMQALEAAQCIGTTAVNA